MGTREIFLSFQGVLWKLYRIYKKIFHSDEGDFEILVKYGFILEEIIWLISGSSLRMNLMRYHMSLVTRKPVFGVFNQVRLKPACSATEAS